MLVYHSVQLSHTWSDFSRLLRVMISETRILCHFILVLLSSTLMKQLTCYVDIISLISILVWIFSERDLFQVTGTDASCVLYIICSHSITLSNLCSVPPIASGLLHCWHHLMPFCFALALICFWLNLIVQFTSELSLSCTDLCKVNSEDSDHVIM